MKSSHWIMTIGSGVLCIVVLAGFLHPGGAPEDPVHNDLKPALFMDETRLRGKIHSGAASTLVAEASFSKTMNAFVTLPAGLYHRRADVSVEVEDTIAAYEELEKRVLKIRGEIVEVDIRGNDIGRQGRIHMEIPTERFNEFVAECRKMGKVMREQITAKRLPKRRAGDGASADPDPREIALVTMSLRDEKVAPQVEESRSLLAASFGKSTGHFMKGLAVIVELVGYILPFGLAFLVIAVPALVAARRVRRRREAVAAEIVG